MNTSELQRLLRRLVLGVSATPLLLAPGCGRSELLHDLEPDGGVIPSFDAGRPLDGGRDAGFDAGTDAGFDAGRWEPYRSCGPVAYVGTQRFQLDGGMLLSPDVCLSVCGSDDFGTPISQCTPASATQLICWSDFCGVGRLAPGVRTRAQGDALGRHFADMAAHEAAAVFAFEQLASECALHRLPAQLTRGARAAAAEERRHARLAARLARRFGGRFQVRREAPQAPRSLEALALDNAVEGCVRETLGAMIGLYQSRHAHDPQVRAVMAAVSADELGHSAWSWALGAALQPRLTPAARRRVAVAREEALHQFLAAVPGEEVAALGLPDGAAVAELGEGLRAALFETR